MLALDVPARYELERELGRGGMGTVYRARDRETGESVAIKVLQRRQVRDLLRFSREVGVLSELVHPGIARYLGHGELANGKPALVMEWVEGETLARRLQRGISARDAVAVVQRVADALAVAHAIGVVHRDIKPENIMMTGAGFDEVKLIDFGVARRLGDVINLTRTGMRIGTPCYMSPEQARGERDVDARADVFMLGCVLFEGLTGRRAFSAANAQALLSKVILVDLPPIHELCPEAPRELAILVERMTAKDPAMRPPDAAVLAASLARLPSIPVGPVRPLQETDNPSGTAENVETQLIRPGPRPDLATFVMLLVPPEDDDPDDEDAAETSARDDLVQAIRREVSSRGLRVEVLANGSVLGIVSSAEPPVEVATRLAECALSVKRWAPDVSVAFLSDHGEGQPTPLGGTLERGFAHLETAAMRAVTLAQGGADGVVHLDAATAQLLADRFTIVREADDYQLIAAGA